MEEADNDPPARVGRWDRAILAVLLVCGLRRSEVAALTFEQIQQRDGRWCIVDLIGKHGNLSPRISETGLLPRGPRA